MCKHTITVLVTAFVLAAASFLPCPAQAQSSPAQPAVQDVASKPIGNVVAATGSVTIEHVNAVVVQANLPNQARQTKVGDLVYQGDVVRTGADGRVSINFSDGTSFNLSNNANMTLDEFVYDPNGKSNSTLFKLSTGTFTFVAGKIAKTGDMQIDTPVATMGIRGTTPRVEISDIGTVKFSTLLEEGKSKVTKGAPATQDPKPKNNLLKNLALCNGIDRTLPELQIDGCTAVIDSGERTPAAVTAYNNRGDAYAEKGDYDRAVQDFDQSIKLNPTNAKPFNNSGIAYLKKGEYDLAIKNLDEAIRLNPNYVKAFVNRAETYQKKYEYDRAAHDYDEAIRLEPNSKVAWAGRCWTRAILGELQAALEYCNKALQSEPTDAATYDSRGLTYMKMGQFDTAIDDYNSALRFEPKLASALYGRGLAKLKKGDKVGSDADIAAAKKIQAKIGDDFKRYGVQ